MTDLPLNDDEKESCYQEAYIGENTSKLNEICQQQLGTVSFHKMSFKRYYWYDGEFKKGGKLPMYKIFEEHEMGKMCKVIGNLL